MGRLAGLLAAWVGVAGMAMAAVPPEKVIQGLYEGAVA